MHPAKSWLLEQLGKKAAEALRANGFDAVFVPSAEAARAAVLERMPKGASVGFGSSMTLQEIGLIPELEAGGFDLINPPNKKLPDDVVYSAMKIFFSPEGKSFLANVHRNFKPMGDNPAAVKQIGVPYHPGAEKFWKEKSK